MEILARAVGRRKEAVAQIQLVRGNGQFLINDKPAQAYLQNNSCSLISIKSPLEAALSFNSNSSDATIDSNDSNDSNEEAGGTTIIETLRDSIPAARVDSPELNGQNLNDSKQLSVVSLDEIDVLIKVKGGGLIGQAEAIKLGIARAFCIMQAELNGGILRKNFKTKGFLTQDSRVKERRKYGLKKARKASQYHKR